MKSENFKEAQSTFLENHCFLIGMELHPVKTSPAPDLVKKNKEPTQNE